jgi:hypothetical protein
VARRARQSDQRVRPLFAPHQLERLTRSVPLAGPTARAIAVYAEAASTGTGPPDHMRAAHEQGFEGVACVDDAARAIVLYCALWRREPRLAFRDAALGLTRFIAYMQDDDGRFANFILDWSGTRNLTGSSSKPGGPAWQARAVHALACVVATFGGHAWDAYFRRGVRWLDEPLPYLDVRAVGVLGIIQHWRATGEPESAERAVAWSTDIARACVDDRLVDAHDVATIHLWGHLQEYALCEAGIAFNKPEFIEVARRSAEAVLLPALDWCLTAEHVLPFDMSCTVLGLAAVGRATGNVRYGQAAQQARAWFAGRNAAGKPVYDRGRGIVYDGVDEGRVSRNSGAESNIEGGLALVGQRSLMR